ncbi:TetR/AcrR family transcriptional regulator [Microbulbifer hydrolyticus]|uniref:AcrR family transcriptional regulator n=1 Tax=Microbulbifer hydrolyticus TaxID=48074 RepID=A0A6P1TAF0_9GAMM|nr:TetR/AcrR family transcriptional regulator [Microbulbifer hydrolyticus]MBB5210542.1 AcrR family transcriptional regulator [Microbulbifer hydrolyticus]QHQ38987.1 TetR family transcriptional regulator [Microbulbifer hydrolyticus]
MTTAVAGKKTAGAGKSPSAKGKGGARVTARSQERRELILDAAEELFALHGFDGVTLRQIANQAGVDVALTSYYFGPKLELFDAVLQRRGEILNRARLDALRAAEEEFAPEPPPIEKVIEAFLRPLEIAQETEDRGWRNYCALIAYVNNSPVWGEKMISKHFDKLVREFGDAMHRCFPKASAKQIYWCYHNLSGALSLTFADTGRIDHLSRNACQSHDFQSAYDCMIPFMAAGFREVCGG